MFTIRRRGRILGTYPGSTEQDALDELARDEGFASFAESCKKKCAKRDDYKMDEVGDDGRNSDDRAHNDAMNKG